MILYPIASGSSGNCILISDGKTSVLIDAGISGKRIEEGLNRIDMTCGDLDGVLITHEHSDHIKGIGILARRYDVPIYTSAGTAYAIDSMTSLGKISKDLVNIIKADDDFHIGDLLIKPFDISHDAAEPIGFRIENGDKSCAVATDMGTYDEIIVDTLSDVDVLLLESNHDLNMLQVGAYPYYLKRRIMGEKGHLSNDDAGRLLSKIIHPDIKKVYLGHLSRENNLEELALETVCQEITFHIKHPISISE